MVRAAPVAAVCVVMSAVLVGGCASTRGGDVVTPAADAPSPSRAERSVVDGVFTAAQAGDGERTFDRACAGCHNDTEFSGGRFRFRWVGQTAGDLFDVISTTMPQGRPGSLAAETYASLVAYLLRLNGYPAGETPLPSEVETLRRIRVVEAES